MENTRRNADPARQWLYLSELAQFLRTTPSSLQRDLKALVDGGILEQRREGTRAYVKADTRSPLFADLHGLVEKTAGLLPTLRRLLEQFDTRVDVAFVYGSIARGEEHATSDVDLLVIGTVGLAELAPRARKVEEQLGREVNVTSYSQAEFRTKVGAAIISLLKSARVQAVREGRQRDLDELLASRDVQRHRTSKKELDDIRALIARDWPMPASRLFRLIGGSLQRTTRRY